LYHRLVGLLRTAWLEYEHDRARYLAVAMTYYALVSLVPLLLLLLAALGLLLRFSPIVADAEQQMLLRIEASFGPELAVTITRLLTGLQQGSIVATVMSLGGIVLAASVLFKHLRLSFRAIWNYEPPLVSGSMRLVVWTTIFERAIALMMVLGGGALLLAALLLIAATQWLSRRLGSLPLVGGAAGWPLTALSSLILVAITVGSMFKVLPPVPIRWRDVWLASLLCAVSWVVASELLTLYATFFGDGGSPYGALGAVLAFMLWLNVVSQVLFFGAELCKVIATPAHRAGGKSVEDGR
jgi:membrane protein